MITGEEIRNFLVKNSEEKYRDFNKKLMPDTTYEVLGVRTPIVKKLAAEIVRVAFARLGDCGRKRKRQRRVDEFTTIYATHKYMGNMRRSSCRAKKF